MISINLTFIIQLVNVLLLVFLMNFVLFRPIRRVLAQRQQFMDEQQGRIDRSHAQAVAAAEEFNAKIMEARKSGRQKIQEMKNAAYDQEKSMLQEAVEDAARRVQDTREVIQKDIQGAREALRAQVKAFSKELAQKILGRSL